MPRQRPISADGALQTAMTWHRWCYTRWENDQIIFFDPNPDPFIAPVPHVKKATAIEDVSDLFILVEVLVEEHSYFFLVKWTHLLWRYDNLISILIRSFGGNLIN